MKHEILNPFVMAACVLAGIGHFGGAARPVEPPPPPPPEKEEKGVQSFKGRVTAVDTSGRMLTVDGKRMYVPDSTRLTKKGRPITLYDVAVNESGFRDGATSIRR